MGTSPREVGSNPTLLLLVGLSVMVVAIGIERLWSVTTSRRRWRRARQLVLEHLAAGDSAAADAYPGRAPLGAAGEVLKLALAATPAPPERLRLAEGRATRQAQARIWVLGSVGALAPFIGLLGTVLGVMDAFAAIAKVGTGGFEVVSGGLSEALVTTAAGIFVAIEAVALSNVCRVAAAAFAWELHEGAQAVAWAWQRGRSGGCIP